jgi:predicted enzyme related to lactoylglutathione lyase
MSPSISVPRANYLQRRLALLKKLSYFSVAVTDLEESIKQYEDLLGLKQMTEIVDTRWGFRNAMLGNGEEAWIELISPSDENSALARHMRERSRPQNPDGEGIYLVGFDVDDIEEVVTNVKDKGGRIAQEDESPKSAWVHPLSMRYAFIELNER